MIELAEESVAEVLESIGDTFTSHWKEVGECQERITYNPDYEKYYLLEGAGALYIATARDENELVGYIVFIIDRPLHHKDHLFAMSDLIYLRPEYRNSGLAKELLSFSEQGLREMDVDMIRISMKSKHSFERLTRSLGYEEVERMQSKYIGKKG